MKRGDLPGHLDMYRVAEAPAGGWTVEWLKDGVMQGSTFGRYDSHTEAAGAASVLNRIRRAEDEHRLSDEAPGSPLSE
jgi:hypothetical protein